MYAWLFKNVAFPLYESGLRRRNTLKYLRRLEEQQWLSPEEVQEIQWKKLLELLRHAEERVPFYRDRMRAAGLSARAVNSPDDLLRLPMLTRDDVRQNGRALMAEGVSPRELYWTGTAGSTGEPLRFAYSHDSYEWRVAAAARADRWAGWDWGRRQFYIWGLPLMPEPRLRKLKRRLHERLLNRRIVSSFAFTDRVLEGYAAEYNKFRPAVVVGYTNALYEFARFCLDRGLKLWRPAGAIASAERLYDHQRTAIAAAFDTGVFDRYGCREMMNMAAECDHHCGLHLNADNIYVEILKDGRLAAPGEPGEVVATDLNNYGMPLIRYSSNDMAVAAGGRCGCGRGLPLLARVEGRILDVIPTPDGRHAPGEFFVYLLKDFAGVRRFQVVQDRTYAVRVLIEPMAGFERESLEVIREHVAAKLGPQTPLSVELVDDIPLTEGGKLRVTKSDVMAEREQAAASGRS
jgi:phenylacetate-CoA ligase